MKFRFSIECDSAAELAKYVGKLSDSDSTVCASSVPSVDTTGLETNCADLRKRARDLAADLIEGNETEVREALTRVGAPSVTVCEESRLPDLITNLEAICG